MHMSAFVCVCIVTGNRQVNLACADICGLNAYLGFGNKPLQKGRGCLFTCQSHGAYVHCSTAEHMQEVNRTNRTYMSMFLLPAVWFKQGHSVSCIPQALFPFNSLDVVLSLGLCASAQGIIYCLFSKANVQAWHISFAEYIWLLKYDFFPSFFVFYSVRWNAIKGASDSCPYCEFLGDNNLWKMEYWRTWTQSVREEEAS